MKYDKDCIKGKPDMDYLVRMMLRTLHDDLGLGKSVVSDFAADHLDDIVKAGGTDRVKFSSDINMDSDGTIFSGYVLLLSKHDACAADLNVVLVAIPDMSCASMVKSYAKRNGNDLDDLLVLGGGGLLIDLDTSGGKVPLVSLTDKGGIKPIKRTDVVKACIDSYIADHYPRVLDAVAYYGPDD